MITTAKLLLKIVIFVLFLDISMQSVGQTTLSGKITSLNEQPIPNLLISVLASQQSDMFTQEVDTRPESDGNYFIKFHEPGIYTLEINAVHHQRLLIPIMIFDQKEFEMDIYLVPRRYNNGYYFDKESYRKWIRVYGNFNGYDFQSGIVFQYNTDGSISAMLPAEKDTIRYQVRGITGGPAPLPDEKNTHLRDNKTFEGVIIPPVNADSIELRYDPNKQTLFSQYNDGKPVSLHNQTRALLSFKNDSDYLWIKPVTLVSSIFLPYEKVEPGKDNGIFNDSSEPDSYIEMIAESANKYRGQVRTWLREDNLHQQQKAALYIAYIGLIHQETRWGRYSNVNDETDSKTNKLPSLNFLHALINKVHPLHPLWARNSEVATQLLVLSDFDPKIVRYTQQMIQEYPDDLVVRELVLKRIEEHAVRYNDAREMPEYRWIVERYGESNLARKAIMAFQQAKQQRREN